jgi:predicted kinase
MPGSRCQPANGWFVLVAGWPGSGKSTLAAALAAEPGLPLLAKDEIKEALVEGLGPVPAARVLRELIHA